VAALTAGWAGYASGLAELRAALCVEDSWDSAGDAFQSSSEPPGPHILAAARELRDTPAILWDLPRLRAQVDRVRRLVGEYGLGLSAAVKACRTVAILRVLAGAGLSADVASPGELRAAQRAGFRQISATGPGFRAGDTARLAEAGVLFDAQSPTQLDQVLRPGTADRIGVRLRVPMPDALRSTTSRGANSRFGIVLDPALVDRLRRGPARLSRLRVHTGESTARTLEFRTRYALLAAELFGTVDEINLGGGFLRLSRDPAALGKALATVAGAIELATGPRPRCWFEPGAALVLDSAFLVTEVLDVHADNHTPAVTVDASAWNIAPWAYPSFYPASGEGDRYAGAVFGPTLYEKDRFHPDASAHGAAGVRPAAGDRLVGTSFGAYTVANGRCFAGLELPRQYAVTHHELEVIDD
jgi:diaminopimelate decarboxylase